MPIAIFALAISAFGIGTSEFVINGLLPEIADDFQISISVAGLLVSGFAAGIIVGAPSLSILTLRLPRKAVLQASLVLFIVGSGVSAAASDYWLLMTGRVVSAMAVGAFYGVGSIVAASLVGSDRQASAIALMFAGATAATVFGVPLGTLVGQQLGWRITYWIVTLIGVVGLLGVTAFVPRIPQGPRSNVFGELETFKRPQVWLALAMTAASFGAIATTFTYIAPLLTHVTGFAESDVTLLLFVVGLGLFAGNYAGGKLADRSLMGTMSGFFAMLVLILLAFYLAAHDRASVVVLAFLFGFAGYGLVPGAQIRVVSKAGGAPTLASAMNIAAFNVGVTIGAALGGVAIDFGFGFASVTLVGAAIALVGLFLAIWSWRLDVAARHHATEAHCIV